MNALIVVTALAVLAAWPLMAFGTIFGLLAERLTRSPRVREVAWGVVLLLPVFFVAQAMSTPLIAKVFTPAGAVTAHTVRLHASLSLSSAAHLEAPPLFERLLARPESVWIAALILALSVAGLIARLAMWASGAQRLVHVVRHATTLEHAPDAPPMLVSDAVDRPMLAGLRRPAIVIPAKLAQTLDAERVRLIVRHEEAHWRRGDNWRRPFEEALLGFFWMTPPLAWARSRMAAATEEVCDAHALANAEPAERRLYAQALVDTLRLGAGPEHAPAFIGSGRRSRLMRMNAILNPARPARPLTVALLCGAGAVLMIGAGFAAKSADAQASSAQPDPAPALAAALATDGKGTTLTVRADGNAPGTVTVTDEAGRKQTVHVVAKVGGTAPSTSVALALSVARENAHSGDAQASMLQSQDRETYALTATSEAPPAPTPTAALPALPAPPAPPAAAPPVAVAPPAPRALPAPPAAAPPVAVAPPAPRALPAPQALPPLPETPPAAPGPRPRALAYRLNGKPVPAGFDLDAIPPSEVVRIEVGHGTSGETMNIVTKKPAG